MSNLKEIKSNSRNADDNISNDSNNNKDIIIDFDIVLKYIGSFGKYQLLLVLLAYYVCLPCGMHQVGAVFLAAIPSYRCYLEGIDNNTNYDEVSEEDIRNATIPINDLTGDYDGCSRYNYILTDCTPGTFDCVNYTSRPATISCDNGHHYDDGIYESTVTTEWDLVCDRLIIGTTVTSIYYFGVLLSSLFGGNIADLIGRVPTMLVGQMGLMAVGIGCSFSPTLSAFAATRFVEALFLQASYIASFVYVMEVTAGKWRTVVGINIQAAFAIGYMILSGLAYYWRNWRDLQFVISCVSLPFAILWYFLPESPRWLFSKGRGHKAKKISYRMAKRNGVDLPDNIWQLSSIKDDTNTGKQYSPVVLFRRPRMRLMTFNIMFNWFVISLVYYGLSLNVGTLAGDDYINNTLSGLMELIAFPIVIFTIDRFGRRLILSISLLIGGLSCLGSTLANFYSDDNQDLAILGTVLALLGKMAVSGSFAIIYNYTAELYPTIVRSTAVGIGSMAARVGSVFTPYTLQLQYTIPWLTGTIFGILSLCSCASSLLFPETMGVPMLTTLDEAEAFYAHPNYRETLNSRDASENGEEGIARENKTSVDSFDGTSL